MASNNIMCSARIYSWSALFLVYVNDVPNYIHFKSTIALFADDTELYKSIDFSDAGNDLQADSTAYRNGVKKYLKISGTSCLMKENSNFSSLRT